MEREQVLIQKDIEAYLLQNEKKALVRFITCGNVDDGKSTLLGRLLYDSQLIYEDQLSSIVRESKKRGNLDGEVDFSLLLDGLQAEREQGITIDVAYRYFSTQKRKFIIADTPGHVQYTRNMATGASTASLAIILIDARNGVEEQTKRHSFIAHLLGIKHFIVAVNKMDLIAYDEEKFNAIKNEYATFANALGIEDVYYVPVSALKGENITKQSDRMTWYKGANILHYLEHIDITQDKNDMQFRYVVQYVNRYEEHFRGYSGSVASGSIAVGDAVMMLPSRLTSKVKEIVSYDGNKTEAYTDEAITLLIEDDIDISRGDMLVKPDMLPHISDMFQSHVVWMHETVCKPHTDYLLKFENKIVQGYISNILYKKDMNTLMETETDHFEINEIGVVSFQVKNPIMFDEYEKNRATGRFIIIDKTSLHTVGVGMIYAPIYTKTSHNKRKMSIFEKLLLSYVKKKYPHWNIAMTSS